MSSQTLMLLGLGGAAAAYALTRKGKRKTHVDAFAVGSKKGDAFEACTTKDFTNADVNTIVEATHGAVEQLADEWSGAIADAESKAHDVAMYVMESMCPSWPRPTGRHSVEAYKATYGEAWVLLYDASFSTAFNLIIQG